MLNNRTKRTIAVVAVIALALWLMRKRSAYEQEEEVKDAAKEKEMSQKELNAVLKFIR